MPSYYNAPGAAATDAISGFLLQREAAKRQAMLDSLATRRAADEHEEALAALAEKRAESLARVEEKERGRVISQIGDMVIGDIPDPDLIARAKKYHVPLRTSAPVDPGPRLPAPEMPVPPPGVDAAPAPPLATPVLPPAEPMAVRFGGNPAQIKVAEQKAAQQKVIGSIPTTRAARLALEAEAAGLNPPAEMFKEPEVPEVKHSPAFIEYTDYANEERAAGRTPLGFDAWSTMDANRRKQLGQNDRPYFTIAPLYDSQGRPIGALRTEGRTGKVEFVNIGSLAGGQLRPPPGDLGKQTIMNEASLDALDNLRMLREPIKDLTGPLGGRVRSIGQQIPGVPVDEDWALFDAATAAFRNAVIKAITGAQMSEPEARRIREQIPEVSDKPEVWAAKARQTEFNLKTLEDRVKTNRKNTTPSLGIPMVGSTFQGGKVLKVTPLP